MIDQKRLAELTDEVLSDLGENDDWVAVPKWFIEAVRDLESRLQIALDHESILTEEVNALHEKLALAREAIEKAPHSTICDAQREILGKKNTHCDCWKAKALAEIGTASGTA